MKLDLVENSSNVAAAGYLEDDQVLLVRFHDGALYARPGVTAEVAAQFDAAPSKGKFLAALQVPAIALCRSPATRPEPAVVVPDGPLQTYQPDDCCGFHVSKAMRLGKLDTAVSWECPRCGTEWHPGEISGVRHWSPFCPVVVFR